MVHVRCQFHGLACGPDGHCVLCRREALTGSAPTRVVWGALGAIALTIGAGVSYRTLASRTAPATVAAKVRAAPTVTEAATDVMAAPSPRAAAPGGVHSQRPERREFLEAMASATGAVTVPAPSAVRSPEPEALAPPPPATLSLRDVHVIVYTTGWCSVCRRAKAWMATQGIRYEERNIDLSSEYAQRMRALNPRGSIPTFDVEGDVMVGFSEQGLVATMQRAARRAAARSQL